MMMKTQIRDMVPKDLEVVVGIIEAHNHFDGVCARRYFQKYFGRHQQIESPDEKHFVVLNGETEKVVGVSGYTPDKYNTPEIYWLGWTYVYQDFRRRGLGAALLQHAIDRVKALGARKLYIDTSSDPTYGAAVKLYQAYGFREEGVLRDYYGEGEHYLILGKYLKENE